ncbi:MAG: hypothetical protein ACOX7J_00435 [Bacillota bacterium]
MREFLTAFFSFAVLFLIYFTVRQICISSFKARKNILEYPEPQTDILRDLSEIEFVFEKTEVFSRSTSAPKIDAGGGCDDKIKLNFAEPQTDISLVSEQIKFFDLSEVDFFETIMWKYRFDLLFGSLITAAMLSGRAMQSQILQSLENRKRIEFFVDY